MNSHLCGLKFFQLTSFELFNQVTERPRMVTHNDRLVSAEKKQETGNEHKIQMFRTMLTLDSNHTDAPMSNTERCHYFEPCFIRGKCKNA